MTKREYAFYPGCSSQLRASPANYLTSVSAMGKTLDVKPTPIPDWNCFGASISYAGGGELERHVARFAPDASEALQLAARSQHIQR